MLKISDTVGQSAWMKLMLSALMTLVWLSAHLVSTRRTVDLFESDQLVDELRFDEADRSQGRRLALGLFSADLLNYFSITCALAITAITRVSFLVKTIIILIVILQQVILNNTTLADILAARSAAWQRRPNSLSGNSFAGPFGANDSADRRDALEVGAVAKGAPFEQHLRSLLAQSEQYVFGLTLFAICWALFLMNRQFELTNRRLFLWRKQVEERKEKVADMRRKNEALVYNILPPNVAKIFLGKRQLNDEELYSKSYDAVGVLFAAMPNFSDFYTEESVNNQGLECLRFLNEVISDYDALLDKECFKNIIKIKTMGSTYMAASGLYEGDARAEREAANAEREAQRGRSSPSTGSAASGRQQLAGAEAWAEAEAEAEADERREMRAKWGHLEQLTEFALALKETLNNINKESFNNFVLRIGKLAGPSAP